MGRSVLAFTLTLLLVIAAVSACQSTTPTPTPTDTPPPSVAAPTPLVSPTEVIASTPTPTPDPNAGPTPLPTGAPGAFFAVRKYEDALLAGDYNKAWSLLGKGTQNHWGTVAAFKKDRSAFLATAGTAYQEELSPTNTLTLRQWVEGASWMLSIDQTRAYVISVKWPALTDPNKGWEIWVASPSQTGWLIYLAH
jgi:hypothetical protein